MRAWRFLQAQGKSISNCFGLLLVAFHKGTPDDVNNVVVAAVPQQQLREYN